MITKNPQSPKDEKSPRHKGGRNLILLGTIASIIALATTSISLIIYHNSGDIYLDRSRPGFLPEENDPDEPAEPTEIYTFEKSGKLTISDVEEYLEKLEADIRAIDEYEKPFSADILSDENLGIKEVAPEE